MHMPELPSIPNSNDNTDYDTGTPRWVKLFGIIALVVIVLFIILILTRGSHGPSRHTGGTSSLTPSTVVSVQVV